MGEFKAKATRNEYCHSEDVNIVKYLMKKDAWHLCNGNLIWQRMEKAKICPNRTFQSLRNRYLRNIQKRLKTDFRHILCQSPNRRNRLSFGKETSNATKRKQANFGLYDDPQFEPSDEDVDNAPEEINKTPPIAICAKDYELVKNNMCGNAGNINKYNPTVVLTRLNFNTEFDDGWLTAGHLENNPRRKQLYCDPAQSDIVLDQQPCNTEVDDSESIYFSVACARNNVCLDSQDVVGSNDVFINDKETTPKTSIINMKRFSKNSKEISLINTKNNDSAIKNSSGNNINVNKPRTCTATNDEFVIKQKQLQVFEKSAVIANEKDNISCKNVSVNDLHTQEVIDLTDNEVQDCASQHSTPSLFEIGTASQTDLFSPNQKTPDRKSEKLTASNSPKSQSFVAGIRTKGQRKLTPNDSIESLNIEPLHYLGLEKSSDVIKKASIGMLTVNNTNDQNESLETSQYSTAQEKLSELKCGLSVKETENCNIVPTRRTLKINSRMNQYKLISRRIVELHQMIRRLGESKCKRHQRQLNSLARYILNLKGRKSIQEPANRAKPKTAGRAGKAQNITLPTQVPTRKSTRITAGQHSSRKDFDETNMRATTSTPIKKPKDSCLKSPKAKDSCLKSPKAKPKENSILLKNMLACLDTEKSKRIRKSLESPPRP